MNPVAVLAIAGAAYLLLMKREEPMAAPPPVAKPRENAPDWESVGTGVRKFLEGLGWA